MATILEKLLHHDTWLRYLDNLKQYNRFQKKQKKMYEEFILGKRYAEKIIKIINGDFTFPLPRQHRIGKISTGKKRIIYTFPFEEQLVLKVLNMVLADIDLSLPDACHSFRRGRSAKTAFKMILSDSKLLQKHCLHIDIEDYFNSIDVSRLFEKLPPVMKSDRELMNVIKGILLEERSIYRGTLVTSSQKGVMAGMPLSPILSNIYLSDLDDYFMKRGVTYARYSDDIILFSVRERVEEYRKTIEDYLENNGLRVNREKSSFRGAGEVWEFLGFRFNGGSIDLSEITVKKIKGKISRAARKQHREMIRRNLSREKAIRFLLKRFNRKFYGAANGENIFSWARWFFPLLSGAESLKEIDRFMQEKIRYLATGRYNKNNYKAVPYKMMKKLGYIPLTGAFYLFRKDHGKFLERVSLSL